MPEQLIHSTSYSMQRHGCSQLQTLKSVVVSMWMQSPAGLLHMNPHSG